MERNGLIIQPAVKIDGYEKHFDGFDLGPMNLEIPQGFTTAIIGENGAGKTTLLDALGGITSSRKKITWLGKYTDLDQHNGEPRNEVAWCAANRYFPISWTIKNVKKSLPLAFDNFSMEKFERICRDFGLSYEFDAAKPKKLSEYSDGNRARLVIASVLARSTKLMILDEPDAALDPVIRDVLNSKFREYINNGNGETSILFSTHNIADMESVVDYVVFLAHGRVLAQGFVEDLREQYRYVHGPRAFSEQFIPLMPHYYFDDETGGEETVEGLCLTENADKFDDHFAVEVPTLQQLTVLILRSGE
ncbi:MAG: ABC transporter ATP-binding protein [Treponema sp.]|nr:ABC transporter ATP-binding protein [Treponema sp.]